MSDINRRLSGLEKIWPPPAPWAHREPVQFDWARLSEADRETYEEISAAMEAVDLGPVRLDERADLRARLDALSDDDFARLEALTMKVERLIAEDQPA